MTLQRLEAEARAVRLSGADRKWTQLNAILDHPLMTVFLRQPPQAHHFHRATRHA